MAAALMSQRLIRAGIFSSQSRDWLTERFAYQPRLRLVFDEESPQFVGSRKKSVHD
jgi:hypothetical protein